MLENKVNANVCSEGLGICNQCDERCKARHGPTGQGMCDRYNLCTCNYICAPVPPPPSPPTHCSGGAGLCDTRCGNPCCNQSCAQKYPGGVGFCDSLAHTVLCKCQYPC
ncbi:PREDICTED: defensin-like protein 183 [Brassica oleracea var. oleracea]|uniref:defensin-like protein 183 n=1 Tax=Brassica oleracea var. oleracea TaxID=109376 RepID=UPI0006A73335|nr:PREDICTED: defensin-like protein 183 [Brassica oleracea var. oleracea]